LREKMAALATGAVDDDGQKVQTGPPPTTEDGVRSDALSALLNLGYQRGAAEKAIDTVMHETPELNVETVLRSSLRKLARI
jgi:Holliday junction resolvasome RuvABC DNA-binding subunit